MGSIIDINYGNLLATTLNLFLLIGIIVLIYKFIKEFRHSRLKNKEMREKIDFIYNKLKD